MTPWWVVALAALVLGVVGHLTGRELATGGYRIPEDEADHPTAHPWWTGPATGALAGLAAWSVGDLGGWAALPVYLLFAWLTVGLVWIDLDVHRLPVGLVVPTGGATVVLLAVAILATDVARWQGTVIGAVVMGAFYLLLAVMPGGGVGGGDVRLAPLIGAVLGFLGARPGRHRDGRGVPHRRDRRGRPPGHPPGGCQDALRVRTLHVPRRLGVHRAGSSHRDRPRGWLTPA